MGVSCECVLSVLTLYVCKKERAKLSSGRGNWKRIGNESEPENAYELFRSSIEENAYFLMGERGQAGQGVHALRA